MPSIRGTRGGQQVLVATRRSMRNRRDTCLSTTTDSDSSSTSSSRSAVSSSTRSSRSSAASSVNRPGATNSDEDRSPVGVGSWRVNSSDNSDSDAAVNSDSSAAASTSPSVASRSPSPPDIINGEPWPEFASDSDHASNRSRDNDSDDNSVAGSSIVAADGSNSNNSNQSRASSRVSRSSSSSSSSSTSASLSLSQPGSSSSSFNFQNPSDISNRNFGLGFPFNSISLSLYRGYPNGLNVFPHSFTPPAGSFGVASVMGSSNVRPDRTGGCGSISNDTGGGTSRATVLSFECCVCLECLDAPASISQQEEDVVAVASQENSQVATSSRGRGGARRGRVGSRSRTPTTAAALTDIVSTYCGHLYHRVCLERWFTEQGKRTCPSCRKSVPASKVVRLYPSTSDIAALVAAGIQTNESSTSSGPNMVPGPSRSGSVNVNVPPPPPAAAAPPIIEIPRGEDDENCDKQECRMLRDIQTTLINDYDDLQRRYDVIRENEELKEAQIQSLEIDRTANLNEIIRLKRELEDARNGGSEGSTAKRRRQ